MYICTKYGVASKKLVYICAKHYENLSNFIQTTCNTFRPCTIFHPSLPTCTLPPLKKIERLCCPSCPCVCISTNMFSCVFMYLMQASRGLAPALPLGSLQWCALPVSPHTFNTRLCCCCCCCLVPLKIVPRVVAHRFETQRVCLYTGERAGLRLCCAIRIADYHWTIFDSS